MRIMIKGGVWKNTEDEILKAAVMKYGKNQWSRVSSLLVRKSAKQCKARWYEWLDPSIKKTEWTREEDEKLLHLAKLMPTQWRTIAPIVGRTSTQCLERYERLLDQAAGGSDEEGADPRRLRPGEIDPNPESRPAKPDPLDMDEDEKEMLNEARARLANTKGKKAKRKAREKQLEEARRLASLQKRRELKAAGIMGRYHRKVKGIDYNAEIAFEHKPPPGFYDTSSEQQREKEEARERKFRPVRLDELEGKKRKDIEAALIKSDRAKQQILERHNMPLAVAQQMQEASGPSVKRGKLSLPAPQLSDSDLRQIAQMNEQELADQEMAEGAGGKATKMLLADYSATPAHGATPARTPRTPSISGSDTILQEAENLAKLQGLQSTLMGGEGAQIDSTSFSGAMPQSKVVSTPNPLATPLHAHNQMFTPSMPSHGSTPAVLSTPIRDGLQINRSKDTGLSTPSVEAEERHFVEVQRQSVKLALDKLPAPKNEYQVIIPELVQEESKEEDFDDLEDMADVIAKRKAREEEEKQAELRKRSQVLQRGLPRPQGVSVEELNASKSEDGEVAKAAQMILNEVQELLQYDNMKYPTQVKSKARSKAKLPDIDIFEENEIFAARQVIEKEITTLVESLGDNGNLWETHSEALQKCHDKLCYKSNGSFTLGNAKQQNISTLKHSFGNLKAALKKQSKVAEKLEEKVGIMNGGLQRKNKEISSAIQELFAQYSQYAQQLESFRMLSESEKLSAPQRMNWLQHELQEQKDKEGKLQKRYSLLLNQYHDSTKSS